MLSQTAEYALRAVLYLANHCDGDRPIPVDEIGEALGIPANYLSKTLNALVREKVLRSSRGPRGGFCLAVSPARLTLARVVGPFDTLVERRACLLGRPTCSDHSACAAHQAWKATAEQVLHFFRTTTVADIAGSDAEITAIAAGVGRAGRPAARAARA